MSEKKYVLERYRSIHYPEHVAALTPGIEPDCVTTYQPLTSEELEFYRRHPDVEDRTHPSYADVPVGTAGTATVRGVEGVRVMRTGVDWYTRLGTGTFEEDEHVTDFRPDVVVDVALIGRVVDTIRGQLDDRYAWVAETVAAALRGQS